MLDRLARMIEGLLFASDRPLSAEDLCELTGCGADAARQALLRIADTLETDGHAMLLLESAGAWRLATDPELGPVVSRLFDDRRPGRLSRASMEALAVIAYNQPCTKAAVEAVRGVNCDSALRSLLERGLVRICGRQETAGRPLMYSTTEGFLSYFGLKDLDHLPRRREIEELLSGGGDAGLFDS